MSIRLSMCVMILGASVAAGKNQNEATFLCLYGKAQNHKAYLQAFANSTTIALPFTRITSPSSLPRYLLGTKQYYDAKQQKTSTSNEVSLIDITASVVSHSAPIDVNLAESFSEEVELPPETLETINTETQNMAKVYAESKNLSLPDTLKITRAKCIKRICELVLLTKPFDDLVTNSVAAWTNLFNEVTGFIFSSALRLVFSGLRAKTEKYKQNLDVQLFSPYIKERTLMKHLNEMTDAAHFFHKGAAQTCDGCVPHIVLFVPDSYRDEIVASLQRVAALHRANEVRYRPHE